MINRLILLLLVGLVVACQSVPTKNTERQVGLISSSAMVVSAHPLASKVGVDVMRKGGNAVDAAVATQLALAVVHPSAGNVGGGGFMVIRQRDGSLNTLDYREKAPA